MAGPASMLGMALAVRPAWNRKSGDFFRDFNATAARVLRPSCVYRLRRTVMKSMLLTLAVTGMMMTSAVMQAQEIQQRKENQQDRIANGVANGSLTPHETANLEHKEAGLNHEIRHDRRQNGGNLQNKEKTQVNRQQNQLSRNI